MIVLRDLHEPDVAALQVLQHASAGEGSRWSMAHLRSHLYDADRDHGRLVVVAERNGEVVGGAGCVEAVPWYYGSPVLARDREAADALVAHLVTRAYGAGAAHVRITATGLETPKATALTARGFTPVFDFVTVARSVRVGDGALWETPWIRRGHAELDLHRLLDVHNETFEGVPNSAPVSAEDLRAQLDDFRCDRALSAAWEGTDEHYLAFVLVTRDSDEHGRYATEDAIGVRREMRGRGVARAILADLAARAGGHVEELRAVIASTNVSSLRAHAASGFTERSRSTVYQLDL